MSDRLRRAIAWWQIGCGGAGILMFGAAFFDLLPNGRLIIEQQFGWINYTLGVAFFSFTIAAGRALLKGVPWGLRASSVCQALQVCSFAFLNGPHVRIQAGPFLGFKASSYSLGFSAGFQSSFFIGTRVAGPTFEIAVNLLAATWAILLVREVLRTRRQIHAAA
jgi:hypothetical protein